MKKRHLLALIVAMTIMLVGCGNGKTVETAENDTETETLAEEQTTEETTELEELADTEEPTEIEALADTEEPTEIEEPTETKESTDTKEPTQTKEPTEETVQSQYTYTDMSETFYAKSSVNVRDLPGTDGTKLGGLSKAQEVTVTGQCNETSWYRIDYNEAVAYVSDSYLIKDKPVATTSVTDNSSSAQTTTQAATENTFPYPLLELFDVDEHTVGYYFSTNYPETVEIMNASNYGACELLGPCPYQEGWGKINGSYEYVGSYDVGEVYLVKRWYIWVEGNDCPY